MLAAPSTSCRPILTLAAVAAWVVAMVDGLAFPAVNILDLAPAYPALALFWCAAAMCVVPAEHET